MSMFDNVWIGIMFVLFLFTLLGAFAESIACVGTGLALVSMAIIGVGKK